MAFSSRLGVVGLVNPTLRPGPTEELIRILPDGVGVIPLFLNIQEGTQAEFKRIVASYEPPVKLLAEQECDLIHLIGAPPFMVFGRDREAKLIARWQKKYRTAIFTVPQNHVAALNVLGAKRIVGATYFPAMLNTIFAQYMREAGFEVLAMDGIDVPFHKVQELPERTIYAHIKRSFRRHPGADAVYMLGSGWRTMNIIARLEDDLGVPVVHPVTARAWEILKRLRLRKPIKGYGILLEKMP
jgi:maleate cis-trans isomerase